MEQLFAGASPYSTTGTAGRGGHPAIPARTHVPNVSTLNVAGGGIFAEQLPFVGSILL